MLGWIFNCTEYIKRIVLFCKSTRRADCDALSAAYAAGICQLHIERAADIGVESSLVRADDADALILFADRRAPSAKDTFIIVANQMDSGSIQVVHWFFAVVNRVFPDVIQAAEGLQFAVAAADTGKTFPVMGG